MGDELKAHAHTGDIWIALHGLVYDVSAYRDGDPGGSEVIEALGGRDATADFEDALHSTASRKEPQIVLKGVLEGFESQVEEFQSLGWSPADGVPDDEALRRKNTSKGRLLPMGAGLLVLTTAVVAA